MISQDVTMAFSFNGDRIWINRKNIPRSKIREIVKFVRDELRKEGGVLIFDHQHEDLEDCDEPCYFSYEPNPMIKIAIKDRDPKDWIPDLLHEFSHFVQWRDDTTEWKECFIDDIDMSVIAGLWVRGTINLDYTIRHMIFNSLARLEYAAELNTMIWLEKFELQKYVNLKLYAQKANAYVLGYLVTKKIRKWVPKIYEDVYIVQQQSTTICSPINLDIKTVRRVYPYYEWDMFEPKIPEKKGFWSKLFNP